MLQVDMPMPTHINGKPVKTGSWTSQEDRLLAEWQAKLGNRWSSVAKKIPGRTGQQCAQRWRHKVNPNIRKEKWTEEEDRRLLRLVKQFGNSWAEISRRLDGRTDQQCMGRWRRHLDPSIKRDAWQPHEDTALQTLYLQYGSQWSAIAHGIHGRTAQQCRARFFQVEPDSAGGARCNRDHADEDGQEGSCAECEMEEIDTRRPVQRPARKRARRARRSPSLSAFEGEDDSLVRDSDSELDMHAVDSEPPSDFPTPLKNAYARATATRKDHAGANGGGFTRSGRAVTANGSLPEAEAQPARISARRLSAAVTAALKEGRRAVRRLSGHNPESDGSPQGQATDKAAQTPSTTDLAGSEGRRSSGRKSSGRRRSSTDPSPPFLSPMRNCHSMPSESQLLHQRHFDARSPQSVRHRPSGATLQEGASPPAAPSQATPAGPSGRSPPPAQGTHANGTTRWRTASPAGLSILQLLQSPHHVRDGMVDSPKLGDKGLVTPEWARQRGRDADEAVTAPPLAHPGSSGRPSRSVARRLNIDQAFKGSARGKRHLPGVPHTVPQEQMGAPRRLGVSPAKRLRIGSPSRGRHASGPEDGEEDEDDEDIEYADAMTHLDFDDLRQQERRKARTDKENHGTCNALQQLCVAAASASAAEEAANEGRQAAAGRPEAGPDEQPQEAAQLAADLGRADPGAKGGPVPSAEGREDPGGSGASSADEHPGWLDRLAGADGSVQATLEARNVKHEAVPDGKPASTSSHLRMRLHALLEDLAGVI